MDEPRAHVPVLLDAALEGLRLMPDGCYLDGTYGRGGHAAAILARLGTAGRLYALDRDPEAVAAARARFGTDGRFTVETVQCLASCGTAPAMRVNDQLYENLTPAGIDAILERLMGEV